MKKCVKALSVLLATLMLLSTVVVGAAAESSAILVNGTELIITTWGGVNNTALGNPTKGEVYVPGKDASPLVPELPSTRLTFGWNKEGSKFETLEKIYENDSDAKVHRYNDSIQVGLDFVYNEDNSKYFMDIYNGGDSKGLMFYIKLHENSEQTNIYLEGISVGFNEDNTVVTASNKVTQSYNSIIKDKDVYLMPAGTGTNGWDKANIVVLGNGEKASGKSICLDGGFEGWVYIPAASWIDPAKVSTLNYLYRVNWYVSRLVDGEDFQISNLMLVDDDVTTADGVKVGNSEYIFDNNRYYSTTALNVDGVSVSKDDIYKVGTQDGQIAPSYGAANSSLNPTLLIDSLSEKINPISLYKATVASSELSTALDSAQRPKNSTHWAFFDIVEAKVEGRNLYNISFKDPQPFSNGYTSETPNTKINKTYGEQYIDIFDVENVTQAPTAYVGGPYKVIGYNNNITANFFASITPLNLKNTVSIEGKSILVYVKHTYKDIADEDKQPMNATFMLGDYFTRNGYKYYSYDNTNKLWVEKEIIKPANTGGLNAEAAGAIQLDKDFEGWVMIPASSFWKNTSTVATVCDAFKFTAERFGGIYGDVILGDIAVLDFEDPFSVASGSQFVSANENALVDDFPFEQPMEKTADATTRSEGGVNGFKDANDKPLLKLTDKTFTAEAGFEAPTTTTGSGANTEVFYNASGLTRVGLKNNEAALTAQNNKSLAFKVDNSNGGDLEAIFGSNYLYMSPGATYYLLGESDTEWEAKESTSTYSLTVGTTVANIKVASITIPKGFVGWVSVPFKYLTVGNNKIQNVNREFVRLDFHPVQMTGSLTINCLALFSTEVPSVWYYDNGTCKGMNSLLGVLPEYSADNEKHITVENGVLSTNYDGLYTSLKASGSIAADGALMFYAKTENAVSFKTSIGDTAKAYTKGGAWTSVAANGVITLDADFEGWVKVEVEEAVAFDAIKLTFTSLTDGLALSDFMTVNQKDDLYKFKNGTRYATGLFYAQGDFNTDGLIDICDLVNAHTNTFNHEATKFEINDQETQESVLRNYILNNL